MKKSILTMGICLFSGITLISCNTKYSNLFYFFSDGTEVLSMIEGYIE